MRTELTQLRTHNQKHFYNDDGTFTTRMHVGHIHYQDDQGAFQDVDYRLEDMGSYWRMVKANYHLYIAKNFGDPNLIRFDNKYKGRNHSTYFEPDSLRWVNEPDLSDMSTFRDAQNITGVLSILGSGQTIKYENAFGSGIHFEIIILRSGIKKQVVIDSLSALENPPTANHRLALIQRYRGDGLKVLSRSDGAIEWDEDSYYESEDGFYIEEISDRTKRTWIQPAYAIDANDNEIKLKLFWKKVNGVLWQAKILPTKQQFQKAVFPVRADDSGTYYSGAGDGSVYKDDDSSWDTTHDATTGSGARYTGRDNDYVTAAHHATGDFIIGRMAFPIDSSGLPDGASISAATFYFTVVSVSNDESDGDNFLTLIQTSQNDPTELVVADYNQFGATDDPTEGNDNVDRVDLDGLGAGQESIPLNSTGIGWVDDTGYTLLGIREGHDVLDEPITGGAGTFNNIKIYTSERTGTVDDPYLEATYTVAGATEARKSWFLGQNLGQALRIPYIP